MQAVLWTDVVISLGTVAAVATALWLGVAEVGRVRRDGERRDAEREKAQAAQLAAWVEVRPYYYPLSGELAGFHGDVSVVNPSNRPLYDLRLTVLGAPWDDDAPEGSRPPVESVWDLGVLPPEGKRTGRYREVGYSMDMPIACSFRDADDRWWLHTDAGYLVRLPGDPHP